MGSWIDGLASETPPGRWQVFGTVTFRTPDYPWRKGFPGGGSYKPSPDFVHHLFARFVSHLGGELSAPVDFVVADQLGSQNGRLHQHFTLAGIGLDEYPRSEIWRWFWERAGFNRILPFERGAAYYIGRYIGRDISRCEWDFGIGGIRSADRRTYSSGGVDVVPSTPMPHAFYKNTLKRWHR